MQSSVVQTVRSVYARAGAGNVLDIPRFGTIYLGVVTVRPGLRHLDMLRVVFNVRDSATVKVPQQ